MKLFLDGEDSRFHRHGVLSRNTRVKLSAGINSEFRIILNGVGVFQDDRLNILSPSSRNLTDK